MKRIDAIIGFLFAHATPIDASRNDGVGSVFPHLLCQPPYNMLVLKRAGPLAAVIRIPLPRSTHHADRRTIESAGNGGKKAAPLLLAR